MREIATFKGSPLAEMDKEELIECINLLYEMWQSALHQGSKDRDFLFSCMEAA